MSVARWSGQRKLTAKARSTQPRGPRSWSPTFETVLEAPAKSPWPGRTFQSPQWVQKIIFSLQPLERVTRGAIAKPPLPGPDRAHWGWSRCRGLAVGPSWSVRPPHCPVTAARVGTLPGHPAWAPCSLTAGSVVKTVNFRFQRLQLVKGPV